MTRHPLFGLFLATFGALVLTPDALFMRLSGMGGYQMVGWRGLLMGAVMVALWALTSRRSASRPRNSRSTTWPECLPIY